MQSQKKSRKRRRTTGSITDTSVVSSGTSEGGSTRELNRTKVTLIIFIEIKLNV